MAPVEKMSLWSAAGGAPPSSVRVASQQRLPLSLNEANLVADRP